MGIARVFLGCAKAARRQARARVSPLLFSSLLRSGADFGDTADCPDQRIPGLNRKVVARPCGGLRLFGVLGRFSSSRHTANRCGGRSPCTTESRRSKGGSLSARRVPR
jgi:hypothetical protein